ncbi:neuropilin-1a-like [Oculina patagonica]
MMKAKTVFTAILFLRLLQSVCCEDHQIKRRSSNGDPQLEMSVTHFLNNSASMTMTHGSEYEYGFTVKHTSESRSNARGVHVTWMLTPFIKIKDVTPSSITGSFRIDQKGDSVTFLIDEIHWSAEANINFSVIFDSENSLKTGRHHIVTPVRLLYYKDYSEDGHVITKGASFSSPLQTVAIDIEIPGCSSALGMASGEIKDYQLTASSTYSESQPNQARPSAGNDAWCAFNTNNQQYIQLDFTRKTRVTGIVTYGRSEKEHWVTRYLIQFSNDEVIWHNYMENGFIKEFSGNYDKSTPVFYQLSNDIEAYSIRVRPLAWEKLICMRFEVFGCSFEGSPVNCIYPLGLESGYIPDEALSHSVEPSSQTVSNPTDIRLNKEVPEFPNGWQAALGELDYLQVDFGSLRKVTRVATQGSYGSPFPFYVESFQFKYSNNSVDWIEYSENGLAKELNGPKDTHEAKYSVVVKLLEPITARYVRFIPTTAPALKVMRAELYGCMAEPLPRYGGVPEYSRRAVLLDPDSEWFYVCMYTDQRYESSCFSSNNGQDWRDIEEFIISIIALDPRNGMLFGVDSKMNFHRSTSHGVSWKTISTKHFHDVKNETALVMSKGIPENMVSTEPDSFWSAVTSNGNKWAVSGSGIHLMAADQIDWSMVASWKCCGN